MEDIANRLIFNMTMLFGLGMFGVFLLCMYLREFPKIKHSSKTDLEKKIYETNTEVDKSNNIDE